MLAGMKAWLILLLCWSVAASAAVYKWVDGAGNVSYSDTPPPGGAAKVMDLPEYSRYKPRALPESVRTRQPEPTSDSTTAPAYQNFAITRPSNTATVHSAEGLVPVELAIEPPLAEAHYVTFLLDGVSIGDRMQTNSFTLRGVERGTHSLQALLVDADGKQLAKTKENQFTLRHDTLFMRGEPENLDNSGEQLGAGPRPPPGAGTTSSTPGRTNPAYAPRFSP
jgi:hypothetical protein